VDDRNALARAVDSRPFTVAVVGKIAVNAAVLGLQTYEGVVARWGRELDLLNAACVAVFVVELLVRLASYWPRPWRFFRDGWNLFDFVVVAAAFVPAISQNSTLLRLARLLRVVRIVRVLPDLRVLFLGVWRSVPPLASIAAVTAMILFVYGMVGWIWFGDELPEQWGDIGRAMLTLFVMLTLENFPSYMEAAMEVDPWAFLYFVTFVLVAAFVVLNVLIGIVLNSMEEARELERRRALRDRYGVTRPSPVDPEAHAPVAERIAILRKALDELELELALGAGERGDRRPLRRARRRAD
jgi:voltage-gated sodium channel